MRYNARVGVIMPMLVDFTGRVLADFTALPLAMWSTCVKLPTQKSQVKKSQVNDSIMLVFHDAQREMVNLPENREYGGSIE